MKASTEDSKRRDPSGAIGGGGLAIGSALLANRAQAAASRRARKTGDHLDDVIDLIKNKMSGVHVSSPVDGGADPHIYQIPTRRGAYQVELGGDAKGPGSLALNFSDEYPDERGYIKLPHGAINTDTLLHELGHGTGLGSRRPIKEGLLGLREGVRRQAKLVNPILGTAAAMYAGDAQTKEEADLANSMANASLLTSALGLSPTLAEEARASVRARALGKKFGKRVGGGVLGPAYLAYLSEAAQAAAPALTAKAIAKYKQRKYQEEERGEGGTSVLGERLLRANRALAGATLGGGVAGLGLGLLRRPISRPVLALGALGGGALGFYKNPSSSSMSDDGVRLIK